MSQAAATVLDRRRRGKRYARSEADRPGSGTGDPLGVRRHSTRDEDVGNRRSFGSKRPARNDGIDGSGSGLFGEAGHLIAMQSASLDMNRRLTLDIGAPHYASDLLIEGRLLDALKRFVAASP